MSNKPMAGDIYQYDENGNKEFWLCTNLDYIGKYIHMGYSTKNKSTEPISVEDINGNIHNMYYDNMNRISFDTLRNPIKIAQINSAELANFYKEGNIRLKKNK